ncbi:MAG TPA: FAD-dependent oxidoreductase, partial [Symbiobacteriaceae bacterium]|nr:FAD-dependent oxidoreductase [Symbiobacteriaceae bacterium]
WAAGARAASAPAAPAPAAPGTRLTLPVLRHTVDVLVLGGGTSGAAAAIGAARRGCGTLLADMNPGPGGTGTVGGVDSYWFGRRGAFNTEVAAWVAEEHGWLGVKGNKWNIEAKMLAWLKGLQQAGATTMLHTVLADVHTDAAGQVTGALLATPECLIEVNAAATVDATGDGDVAVAAGAPYVYGSDREGATMWYSLSPQVRPGVPKNNFTSTVNVGDPFDYTRAILSGRRRFPGHDHGPYIAPRETRHIIGDVRITLTDILTMRRWPDAINVHFSNHDIKGQNTSDWLRMGLIPPNFEIEIPYRAVVPQRVDGLLVTGKAISATHDSLPPLRMQADLENLGYVCGTAAALSARRGITPRNLPLTDLQTLLSAEGFLPPGITTRTLQPAKAPTTAEMQAWIDSLDDTVPLYTYGEVEMDDIRRTPIPIVQICTAGPDIIPQLRAAAGDPAHKGRLHAARALAWYGDRAATPVLLAAIEPHLAGDELPPRTAHIRYTQASPDHGAMPELAYLLHSLAMVRDPAAIPVLMRAAERLKPTAAKFADQMSGIFHYVDAICDIAERLGDPGCLPALRRLHEEPLLHGKATTEVVQPDFFQERMAYLEVTIARAMARCGDKAGLAILIDYLSDSRRMLVEHAHRELTAITQQPLPPGAEPWHNWLATAPPLTPTPWAGPDQ